MTKKDFCYLCPYIEHLPPSFFDPGDAQCPGEFEPENQFCPRHDEWEEIRIEEEENETIEIETQEF